MLTNLKRATVVLTLTLGVLFSVTGTANAGTPAKAQATVTTVKAPSVGQVVRFCQSSNSFATVLIDLTYGKPLPKGYKIATRNFTVRTLAFNHKTWEYRDGDGVIKAVIAEQLYEADSRMVVVLKGCVTYLKAH